MGREAAKPNSHIGREQIGGFGQSKCRSGHLLANRVTATISIPPPTVSNQSGRSNRSGFTGANFWTLIPSFRKDKIARQNTNDAHIWTQSALDWRSRVVSERRS
jgi:hypothetical protein